MTARGESTAIAPGSTLVRAMLWKELREGAAGAAIALVVVALGLYVSTAIFGATGSAGFTASPISISLFTLTSAGAALVIGYKQVTRDDRGDMRALLTHRPATRSQLFWAKAIAAALLYLAATVLPLTIALIWQATPGNRPVPFDIRMALADVADLFGGFVYLFAAMLATIRDVRWYASRLLPFGLALACTTATLAVDHLATALGVIVLALVVIATAAHGVFATGGSYAGQTRASRVTLAISLAFGLQIAGTFALGILGAMLVVRSPESRSLQTTQVAVTRDGTLARVVSQIRLFDPRPRIARVTDLAGRPLPGFEDTLTRESALTSGVVSAAAVPLTETYSPFGRGSSYRGIDRILVPLIPTRFEPSVGMASWYFVRRAGLIAGYDNGSARQIGWLGPKGFTEGTSPPTARFEGELRPYTEFAYNQPLIAMPDAVYRVDLANRQIQRVFTAPGGGGDEVLGAAGSGDSIGTTKRGPLGQFDVVATKDSIHVQSRDGAPQLVVARDPRTMGYGTVTVTRALLAPGAPTFIWYKPSGGTLSRAALDTARDQVAEFGANGALVAQLDVPSESGPLPAERPEWAQLVGVGLLTPLASHAGVALLARLATRVGPLPREAAAPRIARWISVFAGAVIAMIIAVVVARKYAFDEGKTFIWVAVAFIFGALGLLLMASLLDWPARERCPSCGRERVVTRDRCEHCGSSFARAAEGWDGDHRGVGRGTWSVERRGVER